MGTEVEKIGDVEWKARKSVGACVGNERWRGDLESVSWGGRPLER